MFFTDFSFPSDVDECLSSPCANGGQCMDRRGGYLCRCPSGYKGTHCQAGKQIEKKKLVYTASERRGVVLIEVFCADAWVTGVSLQQTIVF